VNKLTKRDVIDYALKILIGLSAFLTVGILVWILGYIVTHGIGEINWAFLSTPPKGEAGGILPMIISTVYIVLLSVVISTPIGVCAAIYLVEYAKPGKIVRIIRFATESLAGIPSIVFGLFGMIFFVTALTFKFSLLSGAITLSIMVLPTIIRTTEEALKAVPNAYREGSLGLGASKLRTILKVVLPSAIPGVLTAVILSIGRIVGETAAVYLTAGMVPRIPKNLMSSGRTLSVHLYLLAKEGISFEKAYATATILIIIVAVINFTANQFARRLKKAKMQ
jgi:phosphate transport system permease protein